MRELTRLELAPGEVAPTKDHKDPDICKANTRGPLARCGSTGLRYRSRDKRRWPCGT